MGRRSCLAKRISQERDRVPLEDALRRCRAPTVRIARIVAARQTRKRLEVRTSEGCRQKGASLLRAVRPASARAENQGFSFLRSRRRCLRLQDLNLFFAPHGTFEVA